MGSSTVEAMLSRCAPIFYGDIRSHERVIVCRFSIYFYHFGIARESPVYSITYALFRFPCHFLPLLVFVSNAFKTKMLEELVLNQKGIGWWGLMQNNPVRF